MSRYFYFIFLNLLVAVRIRPSLENIPLQLLFDTSKITKVVREPVSEIVNVRDYDTMEQLKTPNFFVYDGGFIVLLFRGKHHSTSQR